MTITTRIAKLEQRLTPKRPEPLFIIRRISGQPPSELMHLRTGNQAWTRIDGETEDAFKARAVREALPTPQTTVFIVNRLLHDQGKHLEGNAT